MSRSEFQAAQQYQARSGPVENGLIYFANVPYLPKHKTTPHFTICNLLEHIYTDCV